MIVPKVWDPRWNYIVLSFTVCQSPRVSPPIQNLVMGLRTDVLVLRISQFAVYHHLDLKRGLDIIGRVILKWNFEKWVDGLGLAASEYDTMVGLCEHGNEISHSIKVWHFLTSWIAMNFSRNILHHRIHNLWSCASRSKWTVDWPTNSMEQSPSWEASQEIFHLLWNLKVHYCAKFEVLMVMKIQVMVSWPYNGAVGYLPLPCSQEPTIGPYSEIDGSSPHLSILFL
jgi:hypothetical protein